MGTVIVSQRATYGHSNILTLLFTAESFMLVVLVAPLLVGAVSWYGFVFRVL